MHLLRPHATRLALLSAHTSPLGQLGGHKVGGMNVYVRETALELGRRGYDVDVFTRDDGTVPEEIVTLDHGVRVVHLGAGPREPLDKNGLWEHLPEFLHSLRSFRERQGLRYDLVHSHYWMSGWAGGYLQRLWDVPHVAMFHTLGEAKNRARAAEAEPSYRITAERRIVAGADAIVAASEHEVTLLRTLYDADPARLAVIPCGVNLDRFQPLDRTGARLSLRVGERPMVFYAGRLEPLKGLDLLIEAMALLPGVLLIIAGGDAQSGPYVRELEARARALGIAERVRFAGAVPQGELARYYSAADVAVLPSFYESFGLVALEAMACGTPVVASRVGGLPATIRDGENGYLVPWRTPRAFADRIGAVLVDPAHRAEMSRAALETAGRFRWERVVDEIEGLYERLWERRAARACHEGGPVAVSASVRAHALCHNA